MHAENLSLPLTSPGNGSLNSAFRDIRNYLAGRVLGITSDRGLLDEVIKCLFCRVRLGNQRRRSASEYREVMLDINHVTEGVLGGDGQISLDDDALRYVDEVLAQVDLDDPHSDPLSEVYQAFIGSSIRSADGQFFTPTEAVRWLVDAVDPRPGENIIDPACGAGSFLSFAARHLKAHGVAPGAISNSIYGIDKDKNLSRLAKAHLLIHGVNASNVVCADSIDNVMSTGGTVPFAMEDHFDVVLANPPFGAKIRIGSEATLSKFDLAWKWKKDATTGRFVKTNQRNSKPTPQVLFLELCIRLLKPGGRMGIVVPESMIASTTGSYVPQYLLEHTNVLGVAGMPEDLFKTSGKEGTHTKTCLVVAEKKSESPSKKRIFMAEAKWCGHDSRGNLIPHNDLPEIARNFASRRSSSTRPNLGYFILQDDVVDSILAPRYYDPSSAVELSKLKESHDLLSMGELIDDGTIKLATGNEVGKLAYGTGPIPFVRTSDISNWEIKTDPKHCVSEDIFQKFAKKQDVREGDILMVRDGTYLIGTCAYISKYDTKLLYQSHIYKIRSTDHATISPFLLLAALSSSPVIMQIHSKRFTQDIIDTLGPRIRELVLPIPKDRERRERIETMVKRSIEDRIESRELARAAKIAIAEAVS